MTDFGVQLKQAREQRGISLRQIATATKISMGALEALERNDFSRLPGGIFSRAFVRAYALEVGLDPEQTVRDFLVEYERHDSAAAEKPLPEVTADDRAFLERQRRAARWLRGVSIGVGAVIAAVVIWKLAALRAPESESFEAKTTATRTASRTSTPPARPPAVAPGEAASPVRPAAPATSPAPKSTTAAPKTVATTAAAAPKVEAPAADPGENLNLHLEVTAECWVRVTVDGKVQVEGLLQPGEARDVAPGRDIYLQVGNAGALKWTINGQTAKELGTSGQTAAVRLSSATIGQYVQ